MAKIQTTDLYESCLYLLHGATLDAIEGVPVNGEITCKLTFSGEKLHEHQAAYFRGTAEVNLFQFRRTYNQISTHILQAKRKLKMELRAQSQQREGKYESA